MAKAKKKKAVPVKKEKSTKLNMELEEAIKKALNTRLGPNKNKK